MKLIVVPATNPVEFEDRADFVAWSHPVEARNYIPRIVPLLKRP